MISGQTSACYEIPDLKTKNNYVAFILPPCQDRIIIIIHIIAFHCTGIGEIGRIFKLLVIRDNLSQSLLLAMKSANINNDAFTVLQAVC